MVGAGPGAWYMSVGLTQILRLDVARYAFG